MSFSDDVPSPAAPLSGDGRGSIFDTPDMVLESPTTSERIVDTQSGFLVVVRRLEGRQALSVRRRLGTPPSSSVLLTPDESLKLSRILKSESAEPTAKTLSPGAEEWLSTFAEDRERADKPIASTLVSDFRRGSSTRKSSARIWAVSAVGCVGLALGLAIGLAAHLEGGKQAVQPVASQKVDVLAAGNVDRFVRRFVSDMLDFNPESYKVSQIRAMASMAPELVETYWTDTNFPLSKRQLKALPNGTTVMITKVNQERLNDKEAEVDLFGQLLNQDNKIGNPLHLNLRIVADADGTLRVAEQKDLTAGSHKL